MAANPGRVHTIPDIDLPEYRDISVKKSEQLNKYVNFINNLMNNIYKE